MSEDPQHEAAEAEHELLRLRLRVEELEHRLAAARRTVDELEAAQRSPAGRVAGRLRNMARAGRADVVAAGRRATGTRIPLAGVFVAADGGAPRWTDEIVLEGVALPGAHADPPLTLTYRLLPAGGLRFHAFAGIRPGDRPGNRGGVRFSVTVRDPVGRTVASTELTADPVARAGHRRWLPLELDLGGLAGGEHTLILRTEVPPGADADYAWAAWGDPVLTVGALSAPSRVRAAVDALRPGRPARAVAPDIGVADAPTISFLVPVHDPPPGLLRRTIDSVLAQTSSHWQLCVADDGSRDPEVRALLDQAAEDPRVVLTRTDNAAGISAATNAALALATGEFVAPLDHDDTLAPGAVAAVGARLAADSRLDAVYTDNDKEMPGGARFAPALKPDWSPEYLRACMYTLHLGVYRRELVERLGGWRSVFDGAQDHDLMLRLAAAGARVGHVPEVLYHWGVHPGSAAQGVHAKPEAYECGRRAVEDHLRATGVLARAESLSIPGRFRVMHERDERLVADLIVPLPGRLDDAARGAVAGLADPRDGVRVTVVAPEPVDAGDGVDVVTAPAGTWGALAAAGLDATSAPVVVLFEDLCVPVTGDWLDELAGLVGEPAIGAAGALVVDAEGRTVHAGVALPDGVPLPVHPDRDPDAADPAPELTMVTNRSAAAGVVAFDRAALTDAGGIAALDRLALAATTLAVCEAGRRVAVSPHARLRLVAPPRGRVLDIGEIVSVARERQDRPDPFYNPNLWADRAAHVVPLALQRRGFGVTPIA